ncbi:hypothetical protein [Amycolatopsis sp. VC5-11]|uniref:hypothetical protein n=1 Tax=Amycolatopsis sp. VC5-11 TaxID=3120156 RepID=UPI0030088FF5
MKQYLLAVRGDETALETGEELAAQTACTDPGTDDMKAAGAWVFVGGLRRSRAATVIRPRTARSR